MEQADTELKPYRPLMRAFAGCSFVAAITQQGWKRRAIALKESTASLEHAQRVVELMARTPRYSETGELKTDVPSEIEIRLFAQTVPQSEPPSGPIPPPCPKCAPNDGAWQIITRDGREAPARCDCERGQFLAALGVANAGKGAR